uniref:Uncharacterized protein n=1 Tax=Aegilops tauschii subsp. strangulata TaxID=200361 RepID=A0A453NWZ1_AEGTS
MWLNKLVILGVRMKSKTNRGMQKAGRVDHLQGGGPNWILVAGGVLLSTLSVKLGCKLKQMFDTKEQNGFSKGLIFPFSDETFIPFRTLYMLYAYYAKLQPKVGLEDVNCTQTYAGFVAKLAATIVFQVLL